MSDEPDGREYRDLLLRLIDGIKEDIGALANRTGDLDKIARDAYNKLGEIERRMGDVERSSRDATMDLAQIKAVAKGAGSIAGTVGGAITGALCSLLIAWALRALRIQ